MSIYEFWFNLRNKTNLTFEEKLLLKYHDMLATVIEIGFDESKYHIFSSVAIERIKKCVVDGINSDYSLFLENN